MSGRQQRALHVAQNQTSLSCMTALFFGVTVGHARQGLHRAGGPHTGIGAAHDREPARVRGRLRRWRPGRHGRLRPPVGPGPTGPWQRVMSEHFRRQAPCTVATVVDALCPAHDAPLMSCDWSQPMRLWHTVTALRTHVVTHAHRSEDAHNPVPKPAMRPQLLLDGALPAHWRQAVMLPLSCTAVRSQHWVLQYIPYTLETDSTLTPRPTATRSQQHPLHQMLTLNPHFNPYPTV